MLPTVLGALLPIAAAGGAEISRAGLGFHGSWAYVPLVHTLDRTPGGGMMGCGGLGFAFVADREELGVLLPARRRYSVQLMDVCEGIGAGSDTTWMAPLQVGTGVMAGGRTLYVVAQIEGGLGGYWERRPTQETSTFGVTMRPRAAVGLQMGPVQVEVGPTYRGIVPLLTKAHNAPGVRPFAGAASVDVEVFFGAVAPKPWY